MSLEVGFQYAEEFTGFTVQNIPFTPHIYEGETLDLLPKVFNTSMISLDAGLDSHLDWSEQKQRAHQLRAQGVYLLWKMDFGLHKNSLAHLSDHSHYLSYQLAIDHFKETLWKEFSDITFGVLLYQGSIDTTPWLLPHIEDVRFQEWLEDHFQTKKELKNKHTLKMYCRDILADYLDLLVSALPAEVVPFLAFDCTSIEKESELLQLISLERFSGFQLVLKGAPRELPCLRWREEESLYGGIHHLSISSTSVAKPKGAVVLPNIATYSLEPFDSLSMAMQELRAHFIAFCILPEESLTSRWDGLDYLYVDPDGLSTTGKRILRGFSAAGGRILTSTKEIIELS